MPVPTARRNFQRKSARVLSKNLTRFSRGEKQPRQYYAIGVLRCGMKGLIYL
ncbi:uncharacterized protein PHALS_03608 [Plasmopara halstedii]|uniref:Uncharacterized protein n=1 Tax=Plasmopara halstedii TaxID=4781 RepID=A0A0N7L7F6_PLAHL|nr:uncharacterized protein PHALS_03608 [Plasmopara halstedii]CEG46939.1 hypothetical protein PHALS_03608 [Plasmopara halstedii]|eukprot:XP_024583308.1 hypothetical protein PHALS_03608 [Plasmopara halstedii]